MKKTKIVLGIASLFIIGGALIAADHIDAPGVQGGKSDITDFYAFQGATTTNMVFAANIQGLLTPAMTGAAKFDENVMIEINIDNNNDKVEDLVIQAIPRGGKMYFFGPVAPVAAGLSSTVRTEKPLGSVDISAYGSAAVIKTENGVSLFAGPRDDPFFFDLGAYQAVLGGTATGFSNPGTDTFAGSNVLSVVVELPKSMLGGTGTLNTWVETKSK